MFSETIVSELNKDEEKPWQTLSRGKELNQNRLADMLADFGIRSGTIRSGTCEDIFLKTPFRSVTSPHCLRQ